MQRQSSAFVRAANAFARRPEALLAEPILIYGNGATARLVHSFVRRSQSVIGFTVDDHVLGGETNFCGRPILPFSTIEAACPPGTCRMLIAVGYRDMNQLRLRKYAEAKAKGYRFAAYVDPGLVRHDDVTIGENAIVLDHTSIHAGCRIGDSVFISSNVNLGHDCMLGDGVWVNSGVALGGACTVGKGAFFGVNSCAAQGISIGDYAYIGANTLAAKDVARGAVLISPAGADFRLKSHDFQRFSRHT
jgi:sugar O-acyltransferase (sialic acid O-acetyltransferase NeuD family)